MIASLALALIMSSPALIATPLPLDKVELLPGPFKARMDANAKYLLALEPDRLLSGFRANAGLKPKAEKYGGWESMGVAGHTLGHYLTACSLQYAATKDPLFKERIDRIVEELQECQAARKDGVISAIPGGDKVWEEIRRGEIRSQGFDLNGLWVPWYTHHKVFAGLLDAHQLAGNAKALEVARVFGDWAIDVTKNLTPEKWQQMLACEHGGMNESLAELSVRTGERKYLELARKFHHEAVLSPLEKGEDKLAGLHANTQIPKLIGLARLYEIEAKAADRKAAEYFWDRIVNHRSYVIGGNSNHEHLTQPDQLNDHLGDQTAETCNTYNMLKLTRHLFSWKPDASRFDFYERALLNHIVASQNVEDGMMMYFLPLRTGAKRNHSTPFESFWCCVGTGIENHPKYGESVFFSQGDRLYVNLFIAARGRWEEGGMTLRQETKFPEEKKTTLVIEKAPSATREIAIRKPWWLVGDAKVRVNGRTVSASLSAEGYVSLERTWKAGDRITFELPFRLHTHPMPDNPKRVALMAGPIVLAALWRDDVPLPVILDKGEPVDRWLTPVRGKPLTYRSRPGLFLKPLTFIPYNEIVKEAHTTYFDLLTPAEWEKEQVRLKEEVARQKALDAATVDRFRPGEMQDERDHEFTGENVQTGEHQSRKWRHASNGGWFSIRLKVDARKPIALAVDYWGGDYGRVFDILVDGQKVAEEAFADAPRGMFFTREYVLDSALTQGKSSVVVRFQANPGGFAGGIYGARMVRKG